ncbi:unnamed protein product [Prorocentrum cordatum]|uniref:Uncharacterized protein n=1 Tax=Prorocentrum cordatum TaxID=2364126 RepID=A0ABN9QNR0_9DINO|nr:unnamed protein product [Polarella glacialis]
MARVTESAARVTKHASFGAPGAAAHRGDDADPHKLWVRGFKRPLMASQMEISFQLAKTKMSREIGANMSFQGWNFQYSHAFKLSTKEVAYQVWAFSRGFTISWADPRDQKCRELRVGRDNPLPVRQMSYVLGLARALVKAGLVEKNARRSSMKMGSCTRPRVMMLGSSCRSTTPGAARHPRLPPTSPTSCASTSPGPALRPSGGQPSSSSLE